MKIKEALQIAGEQFNSAGFPDGQLEAEILVRHVLRIDRACLFRDLEEVLTQAGWANLDALVKRRLEGEPLSYLTGVREFYGQDFVITEDVLIPRQETELLVEVVISIAMRKSQALINIVDVGTGSGAIAIAVALNVPFAQVTAVDISQPALEVADINRRRHGVRERVRLCQGNLLEPIADAVDIIVSNPPYLRNGSIEFLQKEVRSEPRIALDGGYDGLEIIRELLRQSSSKLKSSGVILFEIDPVQISDAVNLSKAFFPSASVSALVDASGDSRVILIELKD